MSRKDGTPDTRQRLLEAAGEVFAERGYHDATIREICERATANVAAINYHFGNKEELYKAVFNYLKKNVPRLHEPDPPAGSPEERLRAFVHQALTSFFDEGHPAWFAKLMVHELMEPTKVLDMLVRQYFGPNIERLKQIVRELTGGSADEEAQALCAFSITAQWVFYFVSGNAVKRLNPGQRFRPEDIAHLADHISKFSVAALKGWKR